VRGRGHENEKIAGRIDHLLATVFVAGDDQPMDALTRHVAPDLVGVSPEACSRVPRA
jgi:hypothetical protein